ncbi:MAG: acyltransferase [Candidatus Methanomethylophilaceae archaeon]|nr:acyltransferase [Candidatus Methanomethylophilaceae archaeon]
MDSQTATVKKQNYALHSLTGIILVILTGVKFNMGMPDQEWLLAFGRFAMPLFFIISGYYLFSKDGHSEKSLPRKIKHILLLIVFIKVLYLLVDIVYYTAGVIDLEYLVTAFLVCEESTMHLWFVYALFLLYLWWHIMRYFNLDVKRISLTLSVIVLALSLTFGVLLRLAGINTVAGTSTLYIDEIIYPFIGIPFFTFGYYLHMYKEEFDSRVSTPLLVTVTLIGMITPIVASFYIPKSTLYFGSVLASIGLFMLTFRVPENRLRCRFTEFLGKNLKPLLYAYFPMVVFFLKHVVMTGMERGAAYHILGTVASMTMNLILSYATYAILKNFVKSRKKASVS